MIDPRICGLVKYCNVVIHPVIYGWVGGWKVISKFFHKFFLRKLQKYVMSNSVPISKFLKLFRNSYTKYNLYCKQYITN